MLRDCFTTDYLISPKASILAPFPKWLDWTKILAQLNCRVIWFVCEVTWKSHVFNQYQPKHIIYTVWSNFSDLTRPHTNGGLVREVPLFQKKTRLVKYCDLARYSTNHHSHLQSVLFSPSFLLAQKCILQPPPRLSSTAPLLSLPRPASPELGGDIYGRQVSAPASASVILGQRNGYFTLPETNSKSTWKLMLGRLISFLGNLIFRGNVSFR